MASIPKSAITVRRRRKRLINRLQPLLQLDLFRCLDEETARTIAELKAAIATTTREIDKLETRRVT